jgi:O-antigen/teichoic acid export membrane protein
MAGATIFTTNIVLNLLFIPSSLFGFPLPGLKDAGAALATVLSMALGFFVLRRAAATVTHFPSERFMFSHLSASVIMVIPLFYFAQFIGGDARFFHLILLALFGGMIYVVTLRVVGALTDEDIAFFRSLMSPGATADYMRDELGPKQKGEE